MRSVVLGGGELATALSLSIAANGRLGAMQLRDKTLRMDMQVHKKFRAFRRSELSIAAKPATHLMHWDESSLRDAEALHSLLVAVPAVAFETQPVQAKKKLSPVDEAHTSCLERIVLWQKAYKSLHPAVADASGVVPRLSLPPVVVFSKGLTRAGKTPAQCVHAALSAAHDDAALDGTAPNVFVANGAFVAKDWAEHSSTVVERQAGGIVCDPLVLPSPVTLSLAALPGASFQSRDAVMRLFLREQAHLLDGASFGLASPDDPRVAEIVGLVNALLPVVSLGAGMLSNEYPSSMSALSSFLACALESTSKVIIESCLRSTKEGAQTAPSLAGGEGDALTKHLEQNRRRSAQARGSSGVDAFRLPPSIVASIFSAATNQSSKEFAYGRRVRSQLLGRDTTLAVFGSTRSPQYMNLDNTIEGLSNRISSVNASVPFYEKIIDGFSGFRRAEDVGKRLVSLAACSSNAIEDAREQDPDSLLSIAKNLDRAVETGTGYDEAVARLVAKVPHM